LTNSPVEKIKFEDIEFFIKRDDLLDEELSGNKARKLYSHYISDSTKDKNTLISFGGNQSNLMYSLAAFAKKMDLNFIYFLKPLPKTIKSNPTGNFLEAIKLGMKYIEIPHNKWQNFVEKLKTTPYKDSTLLIMQGALQKDAQYGVKILAKECDDFFEKNSISNGKIFLPSGTGATALYLQKYSSHQVYTTACIGDSEYLISQFRELESDEKNYPIILDTQKKYHFGKLYKEFYEVWQEFYKATSIEFDLLYDPKALLILKGQKELFKENLLYIHCGGIKGNQSMIDRYENRK
jgi:1-aminocyclopropane-1-carboxylate deaminase/D-cysteine desulfhydrase-like pyridoxal-dependent ACC family enzyme